MNGSDVWWWKANTILPFFSLVLAVVKEATWWENDNVKTARIVFLLKQVICIYHQFEADVNEQEYLEDNSFWKTFHGVYKYSEIFLFISPLVKKKFFLYMIEKLLCFKISSHNWTNNGLFF